MVPNWFVLCFKFLITKPSLSYYVRITYGTRILPTRADVESPPTYPGLFGACGGYYSMSLTELKSTLSNIRSNELSLVAMIIDLTQNTFLYGCAKELEWLVDEYIPISSRVSFYVTTDNVICAPRFHATRLIEGSTTADFTSKTVIFEEEFDLQTPVFCTNYGQLSYRSSFPPTDPDSYYFYWSGTGYTNVYTHLRLEITSTSYNLHDPLKPPTSDPVKFTWENRSIITKLV